MARLGGVAEFSGAMHVDVWLIDLSESSAQALAYAVLSDAERARAARFVDARHQQRFTLARAALRAILGARLGLAAAAIDLQITPEGRPVHAASAAQINFNLSHSRDTALIAIAPPVALGIDLEAVAAMPDGVAQRFFAPEETAALLALSGRAQSEAFTRIWTRKEAVVKAIGAGLRAPLDGFVVSLGAAERARMIACAMQPELVEQIALLDCPAPDGFLASVAIAAGAAPVTLAVSQPAPLASLLAPR